MTVLPDDTSLECLKTSALSGKILLLSHIYLNFKPHSVSKYNNLWCIFINKLQIRIERFFVCVFPYDHVVSQIFNES